MSDGWQKKKKGTARIHRHPNVFEGRAVVENYHGFTFYGQRYPSLAEAKAAALNFGPKKQSERGTQ
jgi:hypothetical protein